MNSPLSLIASINLLATLSAKLIWSFVLNIRPRGFYSFPKFQDHFYTWFHLIVNFSY